jgi:hypothetical protein
MTLTGAPSSARAPCYPPRHTVHHVRFARVQLAETGAGEVNGRTIGARLGREADIAQHAHEFADGRRVRDTNVGISRVERADC